MGNLYKMNEKIIDAVFPGTTDKIKKGMCPFCNNKISEFRDELSRKEYGISGLCQSCQDKVFGWNENEK